MCLDRCCPYGPTCGQNNTCCLDGVCAKSDTFFCASTDETGQCQMWQICAFSHSGSSIIGAINATGVCNPNTAAVCTELGFVWCAGACYEESSVCSESFYQMKIPDKASGIFFTFLYFFSFFSPLDLPPFCVPHPQPHPSNFSVILSPFRHFFCVRYHIKSFFSLVNTDFFCYL